MSDEYQKIQDAHSKWLPELDKDDVYFEIVEGDDQMDVLLRFFNSFLVNLIFIDVAFLGIDFSLEHLSKSEKIAIFVTALIVAFVFVAFG